MLLLSTHINNLQNLDPRCYNNADLLNIVLLLQDKVKSQAVFNDNIDIQYKLVELEVPIGDLPTEIADQVEEIVNQLQDEEAVSWYRCLI